ncbi:ADP-ribose diphosphatase [Shewanella corallii]|uniref:ADP-ribose pyrophosphatase n=1 Tax=Shewanella corallii TaxID=560080 RepID=A0ABT0N7F8_9GAMM|nr:ADP-ribose diphosphatase [Shewanella corallii]MCL2914398.1 ADP-ribose diphosphatase [Shewanella corallii]
MSNKLFGRDDVEIIETKPLYQGFFKMNLYRFRHRLFVGGWSDVVSREVFERGHAVVVLPYDPVTDKVVLIEQLRFPALETCDNPWLLELVAGMIEEGETPEDVARRELIEEAGIEALSLQPINSYLASPGGSTERFYGYLATVDADKAHGLHGLDEEHEDIRVVVMDRQDAYNALQAGRIDNASTLIGLQWLQLNYQTLLVSKSE